MKMDSKRNQFLDGLIRGVAERVKSQEEFQSEITKIFPNAKVTMGTIELPDENNDEQEQASGEEGKECSESGCECSQCLLNKALRKLEEETKKKDSMYYSALNFIKNKHGDDLGENLGFYGHLTGLKKEAFKSLEIAVKNYSYACVSLNALREIIEGSKKADK
jgi:hypothetical protein